MHSTNHAVRIPERGGCDRGIVPIGKNRLIWYTYDFKTNEGTVAGVYGHSMKQRFSFSLGLYITILQAEGHAIKECADDNIKRGHYNRNIYIYIYIQSSCN
jgi:hypothetical protein